MQWMMGRPWPQASLLRWRGGCQLWGNSGQVGSLVTRETREGHGPHCPFGKNNLQLGQGPSLWQGQSRAKGPGEAGTGRAGDGQRAGDQPS